MVPSNKKNMDGFPSGHRGPTVNLLQIASVVRIHLDVYKRQELLRYIDHRANTSGNINIKVSGQENIPDEN